MPCISGHDGFQQRNGQSVQGNGHFRHVKEKSSFIRSIDAQIADRTVCNAFDTADIMDGDFLFPICNHPSGQAGFPLFKVRIIQRQVQCVQIVRKIISQLMTGKSGNNGFGLPYIMSARGIVPIRIQLRSHIFPVPAAENKVITDVRIQVT